MVADRRAQRHEQSRREILDAAWRLAERDGVAGLSLREVAREVGMRAPSLYTYFDGKEGLYDAMFAEGYEQLDAAAEGWTEEAGAGDPVRTLGVVAQEFIRFCQASVARYQIMFTRAIPGWEPSPQAYEISVQSYRRSAERLAELGIDHPDGRDLYTAVVSGMAAQQLANDPDGDRWVRLAPRAMAMLFDHLTTDPATSERRRR